MLFWYQIDKNDIHRISFTYRNIVLALKTLALTYSNRDIRVSYNK